MKIFTRCLLAITLIIIAYGNLFAQAPNISYANSPASINRSVAVGTAPNPTLNVTNSGGSVTLASYYTASTFAGSTAGTAGTTNATGTAARFSGPNGLTMIGTTLYVADQTNNQIRAITSGGVVSLLAGSTTGLAARTNGTGTAARFSSPRDIATNGTDLFVADYTNNEIRKVTTAGVVTLLAGSSTGASGTTNATGTSARFSGPIGIVYSSSATALYVADYTNNRIRKVTTAGVVTTLAGSSAGLVNATGTSARFNQPTAVAVDASGNVYVADKGNNQIRKVTSGGVVTTLAGNASGTAGSADGTGTAASFNAPTGITVDASGNIYVYDSGTDLLRHVTTAGVVTTIAGSGSSGFVDGSGITAQFNGAGLTTDASNNIFMADFSNNAIRKITAAPSFSSSPALPAGLTLNATTGAVTGTASVSTAVTNYTITANNYSGSGNTTLTLNTFSDFTWNGAGSTGVWQTATNWTPNTVPGPYDRMLIGLGTYTYEPQITTTETIGSILIGTNDNSSVNITVNGTLNVNGDITLQSDAGSSTNNAHVNEFNGSGTVNAVNFKMIANTTGLANAYQLKMNSSVSNLNITGDISLLTTFASSKANDAKFTVSAGTVTATDFITNNVTGSTSTLEVTGGTLNFTDPTALAGLSANGTNTITLTGGTIGYTGSGAQTVYTNTAITGLPSGITYKSVSFGGTGIKTAASGTLELDGNFTNTLANDVSNYLDFTGATVLFDGTTQSLAGGSGNGTSFKNVTFTGTGIKTMSGKFNVVPTGILTLSGATTTLAAGAGLLTLESDATGSATIPAITAGSSITGTVNVERYITGDQSYSRGYRLISSPVSVGSGNLVWPNLTYISAKTYTTGTLGATNGFDAVGNPTMYLYRENMAPDFTNFISGNNRGIKKINNGTAYNFDVDGDAGTFNIPAGNGLLLFFRGDKATTVNPTVTSTIAKPTTFTATGYLNQGNVLVKNWNTPGSSNLSYTPATPVSVRGYNLVGNPYASSIDWDLITGTNLSTTIWVYNPTLKVFSTYIKGNGGVGTNTNGGNVADIIPSGQGFYVKTTAASPALTFTEAHKVNTQVAAANIMLAAAPPTTDLKYIRVKLTQDTDNKDDALIFFKPGTSSDYTVDEDADYLRGNNVVAISTRVNNRSALAINQMPLPAYKENINLNVIVPANGNYQLSVPETNDMPPQYDIWIKDWLKKDSVNIKTSPTYAFDAVANDSTTFKRRFSIVITTDPGSAYYLAEFKGTKQPAAVVLTWKTGNEGNNTQFTVERSNDDGVTYTTLGSFTSNNSGKYSFTDNSPLFSTENLYRLKHVYMSGTVAYSGTVPISYSEYKAVTKNAINTYPNPATSTIKLKVAEIRDKNSTAKNHSDYTVTIANSQGTTVTTINTSLPETWEGDVSKLAPGVYFIKVYNNNTKTTVGNSKFVKL